MPSRVTVTRRKTPGIDKLAEVIHATSDDYADLLSTRIHDLAQLKAPVRTGYLKRSITKRKLGHGTYEVKVGAHYGGYVEFGTRYMHAQPFWIPAIEEAKKDNASQYRTELHKHLATKGHSERKVV